MEQDDRTKKLLAGKEKLAAFQRKRAKRKKKKETDDDGASVYTWSETSSLADLSDVASAADFSDTGSVVDENEQTGMLSEEENDRSVRAKTGRHVSSSVALVRAQIDVRKMTTRVTELEEALMGKQDVMAQLLEENAQLQTSLSAKSDFNLNMAGSHEDQGSTPDDKDSDEHSVDNQSYHHKLAEFEEALKKRDEVIAQLTENLRATTVSRNNLQQEYTAQAAELARQVQTLQLQLKQAGEWLKNHMGEHGISAQALLEAKNELLALQQVNSHKEQELTAARAAITERDEALKKVIEQYTTAAEQANLLHREYSRLQGQNLQYTQHIEQLTLSNQQVHAERNTLVQQQQTIVSSTSEANTTELTKLTEKLRENQLKIEMLENSLHDRDSDVSKLKDTLLQKDQSLQQMVLSLSSVGVSEPEECSALKDTIGYQQKEIVNLQEILHHKDEKLSQLNVKFSETSAQLKNIFEEVSVLKEKEQEVLLLRQTIREREESLMTLQNTVHIKEEKLVILQKSFTDDPQKKSIISIEDGNEDNHQETFKRLKAEIVEKDKLLQQVSEQLTIVSEDSEKLKDAKHHNQLLLEKLEQLGQEYFMVSEENKQLKETGNEIAEIAEKIPQLSSEIQRLHEENKALKKKENQVYQLVEQMKEREQVLSLLNEENQNLKIKKDMLEQENGALEEKFKSLADVSKEKLSTAKEDYDKIVLESKSIAEENKLLTVQTQDLECKLRSLNDENYQQKKSTEVDQQKCKNDLSVISQEVESLQQSATEKDMALSKFSETVNRLTTQVGSLSEENKRLIEETNCIQNLHTDLEVANGELNKLRSNLEEKQVTLEDTRNSVNILEQQVFVLMDENKALKEAENEVQALKDVVASSEKDIMELQMTVSDKDKEMAEMSVSLNKLQEEASNLGSQIGKKEEEAAQLTKILKETQDSVNEFSHKIDESAEKICQLNLENRRLKEQAIDFEKHQNMAVTEKDAFITELQGDVRSKQIEVDSLQTSMDQQNKSTVQLEQTLKTLTQELSASCNETTKKDKENQDLQSELLAMQDILNQLEKYSTEQLSSMLELKEKSKMKSTKAKDLANEPLAMDATMGGTRVAINNYQAIIGYLHGEVLKLLESLESVDEYENKSKSKIHELEMDNKVLKQQATDLQELQNTVSSETDKFITELKGTLTSSKVEMESLQKKLYQSNKEKAQVEEESDTLREQLTKLKEKMSECDQNSLALQFELSSKEAAFKKESTGVIQALREEVQSLQVKCENLEEKDDLLVKMQGEVILLEDSIKDRDERLVDLTENLTKLTEELSEFSEVNELLRTREDELTEAQKNVQQQLEMLNDQIATLKDENQALAAKEGTLIVKQQAIDESNKRFEDTNAMFICLKEDHEKLNDAYQKMCTRDAEFTSFKDEMNNLMVQVCQLNEENATMKKKLADDQFRESALKEEVKTLSEALEANRHDNESASALRASVDTLRSDLEELHAENHVREKQLETLHKQVDPMQQSAHQDQAQSEDDLKNINTNTEIIAESEQTVPSTNSIPEISETSEGDIMIDRPIVKEDSTSLEQAVPVNTTSTLKGIIAQKNQDILTLHQTVQTQQQALEQMHQQLTELKQYINCLSQENTKLRFKVERSPVNNLSATPTRISESDLISVVTSEDTVAVNNVVEKQNAENPSAEMLQTQIKEHQGALNDMSDNYANAIEVNYHLEMQPSTESEASADIEKDMDPPNGAEMSSADVAPLHAYILQQNSHIEQLTHRMTEMTQYITQVQEQNTLLREQIPVKQLGETEEKQLQEEQLEKDEVKVGSEGISELGEENMMLKQREKESSKVVQQLMKEIEEIRRSQLQTPSGSIVTLLDGSVSVQKHEFALAALRAELEEQHGEQIVEMKQKLREQLTISFSEQIKVLNEQIQSLTAQRNEALTCLEEQGDGQLLSMEEVQSLKLEVQQLRIKVRDFENERAEYINKIRDQQERYSENIKLVSERDATQVLLAQAEVVRDQALSDVQEQIILTSNEKELKEMQEKQMKVINQRILELMAERDQALDKADALRQMQTEQTQSAAVHEAYDLETSAIQLQQVQEMAQQLQDLAKERDEALARIQAQELHLNQPQLQQQNIQNQVVVDALKHEIDALNAQLNDLTSAKEEALMHVSQLQQEISNSRQDEQETQSSAGRLTPQRKISPQQKQLSPMQQHLLHLQQQLLQEASPVSTTVDIVPPQEPETRQTVQCTAVEDTVDTTEVVMMDKVDVRLKQMQEIYDQHCKHQSHQIEQLNSELQLVGREKEEVMAQLEQYQKHYESHVQKLVEQQKLEAADQVKAIHDELNQMKKERDEVTEMFESHQAQHRTQIRELSEQLNVWKGKYHEMNQNLADDSTAVLSRVHAETIHLQNQLDELRAKLELTKNEKEEAKAHAKELKIAYYDLEGKSPDVAGYRTKLEDIEATLKVTWIENEELKGEVASLKSKLRSENETSTSPDVSARGLAKETEHLKASLTAAEAELERLRPLVTVEVSVLMRQMEQLRDTYSHQLRVHSQELTAVKCELARYQSLDSDSSESPVHAMRKPAVSGVVQLESPHMEKSESMDSINIELGRVQAEHQLEVESLKKSKGMFAEELYAEKERHRDAMARIEQLLKKMIEMQQKHKDEIESLKKTHEETVHGMSVQLEEMQARCMVNSNNGAENVPEVKVQFDRIVSERQLLLTQRDQLTSEKQDWEAERDRLKGRIAQVLGEKDLIAKERDSINCSIAKLEKDQKELETQQRLFGADKQQLVFEREQLNYQKGQVTKGKKQRGKKGGAAQQTPESTYIKSLESEVALLRQFKDQVSLLQQERALLVDGHKVEITLLVSEKTELKKRLVAVDLLQHENAELKHQLDRVENEKRHDIENIKEQLNFEISELQMKLEIVELEGVNNGNGSQADLQQTQQELEQLRVEHNDIIKEYSSQAVMQLAEWKLEREKMQQHFEGDREQLADEMHVLKGKLMEATYELEAVTKDHNTMKTEYTQMLEALRTQEAELVKQQTLCGHLREERDILQSEHMHMLDSLQQDGADTVAQLGHQIQELNQQRQAMKGDQARALNALQEEYEAGRAEQQRMLHEMNAKHTQDLQECNARYEADVEAYKQKHAELLEEVHTLRRENYEMRTVVSDPRTQQHIIEVAKTTEILVHAPRDMQADSLSPRANSASEAEKDFQQLKDEHEDKLRKLEEQHKQDLEEKESSLSEQLELSTRQLRVEYQCDLQVQVSTLKDDAARETQRQLKVARIENERKFVSELQNVRRELANKYNLQVETLRQHYEQGDLHQLTGQSVEQLGDVITRVQIENQDLVDVREALLQQIDTAHGQQEELQEELTSVTVQKDSLVAENLSLQQHVATLMQHSTPAAFIHSEPNWHPLPEESLQFHLSVQPDESMDKKVQYEQLLGKYAELLRENQKMKDERSVCRTAERDKSSPSIPDSLEGSVEPPDLATTNTAALQEEAHRLRGENVSLHHALEEQNLAAHDEIGELQAKYITLVTENEGLLAQLQNYNPQDSLDNPNAQGVLDRRETERLQACYATIASENEVLRAKLGSYGLPTESVAEEENLDLASRYELVRKENEALRGKLHAYTHQGSLERDGCWKRKYDAILRDYAILREQLEELGLPINDSIQEGLEELQIKFDQVVKEKEALQGKLTTVRENAEQDFRELQARHSELHSNHNSLAKDHEELKALFEKDKDKCKREYLKIKSKLTAASKEMEIIKSKFDKTSKETEALKAKLDQAENRLKQDIALPIMGKGKKRKQERGNHGKGRKQRRESETQDDSIEMTDQSMQEELDNLKTQYTSMVRENDALNSEVSDLKCELGSLKSRLMDSLRHRLRDPPIAHSTPVDPVEVSRLTQATNSTPTGIPGEVHRGRPTDHTSTISDLDLTSPEDVEALRVCYEAALQELSELRKELDQMNSKALDELMGLQSEADALEEENASMKQALGTDGVTSNHLGDASELNLDERSDLQTQLAALQKQYEEVKFENNNLQHLLGEVSKDHADEEYRVFKKGIGSLTHRTAHSESEIHPMRETAGLMATAASAELLQKDKANCTVSSDSVDVEVSDLAVNIELEKPSLVQMSYSMNTVIPRSALEGGQLEAEWKRILRMRSRVASQGEASITEEGFHPEVECNSLVDKQIGGFIPDSPHMETQLMWPLTSPRESAADLPLMSVEEEFKLQLESMVANFGEQNVREQLGRDYVEIHHKCEAIKEENERLLIEVNENREQSVKMTRRVGELEQSLHQVRLGGERSEVFLSGDRKEISEGNSQVDQLKQELVQIKDENQLLLQENSTLEAQCESRTAKSSWQGQVLKGDLESELEHLRIDKAMLEEEVSKIKGLYTQVKEHGERLSVENVVLNGDKVRLERELQVLRAVLEALRQEQAKVEVEIQERVDEQTAREWEIESTLSAEATVAGKMLQNKSQTSLDKRDGKYMTKKGKKSASPVPDLAGKGAVSPTTSTSSKDSSKGASPMKSVREPPTKVKKTSQVHMHASKESLATEEKVGISQLKQKTKELLAKNKALQLDVDILKKELASTDRTKDLLKNQADNKALLKELEEMRGSLKSQTKVSEQLQDLRARIEALVKEKDMLLKENQGLSDRINDGVSPPMMEFEELKVQNQQLVKTNQSLMEKLDRDLMQAEHELAEMKDKYKLAQMQKEDIEEEYKNWRDRLEKELYNIQSRYDEVIEERDLLETQLISTKEHTEKDYQQLQAGYEEMRNEFEEMQGAYDNDKDKSRKDMSEIRIKLESAKQDNEELKREIVVMREDCERGKICMQQQCAMLQEDKHNLSREIKEYQNRLTIVENTKEDVDKQLKELKTHYESLEKYHEEEKMAVDEENDFSKQKYESLKAEYDKIADMLEEIKMEKNSLFHELNDSHAWCETLEMNLKETESTMHKETVTLKEELRFISEKLETETSVRNNLASAEEELRQKLIETSQELDRVRRDAQTGREKFNTKLECEQETNNNLVKEVKILQEKLRENKLEVESCNTELVNAKKLYKDLLISFEELNKNKEAIENEYRQMRNKFGVTESELVEFRKSYLTENVESGKLMSRFRVQFEQVTQERDRIKAERDLLSHQLEEAKAKYIVQREDNHVLRRAMGTEVDVRFQTVHQLESLLGDDRPPMSPISPLCRSPSVSDSGSECSEDVGTVSGALISKLQRQNTSLALLIEELANIKVARDQQMSRVSLKYQSLQASFNESTTSYNQDRSQLEADLNLLRSQNEELCTRNHETEMKLKETVERCRIVEEELLRLQRNGSTSVTPTSDRTQKKYVVEMKDDLLTVSTVTVEEDQQSKLTVEAMQCSPQISSSSTDTQEELLQTIQRQRRNTDPELAKLKDKTWKSEYHTLQDKYMVLLKEHEKIWQRIRQSPGRGEHLDLEGELTIEVSDSSVLELIEENSRLHTLSTWLENELMSQRIDCLEVDAAYTELTWLKEQKLKLEEKLRLQYQMYDQEKHVLEQRLNELQTSLDKVILMKRKTSEEAHTLKKKYTDLLAVSSDDVKKLSQVVTSDDDREKLSARIAEKERIAELESQLKQERNEKEFSQIQVSHLRKECELYERHVRDLEKEIDEQYVHLHDASREHKTMVQLLAETKLELELNREKHHQVTKIGETVERIEAQLSGRSTPAMNGSPPIALLATTVSGTSSPLPLESQPSTSCGSSEEAERIGETSRIVDEMVQLRQEIMEAKSMYSRESTLLKRAQQQSKHSPGEHVALKEELTVIEDQNELLKQENDELQKRLIEQEELVFHLQARLSSNSTDDGKDTLEAVFSQQITLIKSEREDLKVKVDQLEQRQHKNRDILREKTIMEETFNQEREALKQKFHEKELNEFELIRKISALERHIREQQRLEELIYHKSSLEDDIRRQKESFDHELHDVEKTLQDRRNMIKIERVKLLGELKQKYWQKMLSLDDSEVIEPVGPLGHQGPKSMASGFERLSRMKAEVEQRYRDAIDRLRHELHADYQHSQHTPSSSDKH